MSTKGIMLNQRPPDNTAPSGLVGNFGGGGDVPVSAIGNYKGVMLCNRPADFGIKKVGEGGPTPFASRVGVKEPLGWNPTVILKAR